VPVGGKLLLSGGFVNFTAGSSLTVAGELDIENCGRVQLDEDIHSWVECRLVRSRSSGSGSIQLEGACRLLVPGDLDTAVNVVLRSEERRVGKEWRYTMWAYHQNKIGTVESAAGIITSNEKLTDRTRESRGLERV